MTGEAKAKVYVDNSGNLPPVFLMTEPLFQGVLAEHPALAGKLEYAIGRGEEDFARGVRDADVLVGWDFARDGFREKASRLRWIQLIGAGLDHLLPLDWLPPGVTLTRGSGAHRPKADEFMMLSLLMLNNRVPEIVSNQRRGVHQHTYSTVIGGKTALVVGLGATGTAAAQSCRKLGLKVVGIRKTKASHPDVDELYGPEALPSLLPRADFVIVTVPKNAKTLGLLGRAELQLMKQGAGLVSLARHGIIDEEALADLLGEGRLSGAVYDVDDPRHVPSSPRLWSTENIIIAPHSLTNDPDRFMVNSLSLFFENMDRYLSGRPLLNRVDPEAEY
jgi:phosphoglycerate dehydrogenase-like enzyme